MKSKDTSNQPFEAAWKYFRKLPQSPSLLLAQLVMATVARKSPNIAPKPPNIGLIFLEAALSGMLGKHLQKSVKEKRRDATPPKTQSGKPINFTKEEQEILNLISDGTLHLSGIGFKTKDGATQHLLPPEYAAFLLKILWESTINNPQRKSLVNAIREVVGDIETLPPEKKNDYTETIRRNLTLPYINGLALLILIQQDDGLFCYFNAAAKPKKKYPWQSPIGHPDILGWEVIENTTGMLLRYNGPEEHPVPVPVWNKLISPKKQWPEALRLRPLEPGAVFPIGGDLRKLLEGYRGLAVRVKGDPIYYQLLEEYPDNIPEHLRLEASGDTSPLLSAGTRDPLPAGTRVDDNGLIIVPTPERDPYEDVFLPSEELLQKFIEGTVRALREQQENPNGDSKKIQDFFDKLSNLSLFSETENNAFDKETARYWIAIALRSLQDDNVAYSVENTATTYGLLSHHSAFADKIFKERGFYLTAKTDTLVLKDLGDTSFSMPWGAQYGSRVMIEIPREVLSSLIDLNSILIPDHDPNIDFLNMLNQTRRE